MSFYESEDYQNSDVEIDENGQAGLVLLPCRIVFVDAEEPGQVEDYDPRYQLTGLIPKGHESFRNLIAVCDYIGRKTWKSEADDKMVAVWDCVDKGVNPKNSNISVQDGDLHQPEYNGGSWWFKASRRVDEGRPMLYDFDGQPIFAPNDIDPDTGELVMGELIGDKSQIVSKGDLAVALIRVWAQKKRERLNFSLQGIRFQGKSAGSSRAIAAQTQTTSLLGSGDSIPALPAGFGSRVEEEDKPSRKVPAKKAAKKASAKAKPKAAAKSRGSVFKKKARG